MDAGRLLRTARTDANLSQAALAARAGTSQATLSAYESGRKQPSVATLSRLLAAAGWRLSAERAPTPVREPTQAELLRTARVLGDVLDLAAALPTRHAPDIGTPPLKTLVRRWT